ncbi:hypothetical protein V6Z12_A13G052400 [Gossypium hirsutum]
MAVKSFCNFVDLGLNPILTFGWRHFGAGGAAKCKRPIAWSIAWCSVRITYGHASYPEEEKGIFAFYCPSLSPLFFWLNRIWEPKRRKKQGIGAFRESNSGPLAPKARIIPLDQMPNFWHIGSKGEAKCRRSIAWSVAWFSVRMMDGLLTREEKGKHRIPFSNNHYSRIVFEHFCQWNT